MMIAKGPTTQPSPPAELDGLAVPASPSARQSWAPAFGALLIALMPALFDQECDRCPAQEPNFPGPAPLEPVPASKMRCPTDQRPPPPLSETNRPERPVICFGGGTLDPDALRYMAHWCGSEKGKIVAIGWGSQISLRYFELLCQGFQAFQTAPTLERIPDLNEYAMLNVPVEERNREINQMIRGATGVFLLGGDQGHLRKALRDTGADKTILELFNSNQLVVGGESAGTAVQSKIAIGGREADAWWEENQMGVSQGHHHFRFKGLGTLPSHIIVDQHHDRPGRDRRLLEALSKAGAAASGLYVGVGVHDNSAAIVVAEGDTYALGGPVGIFSGDFGRRVINAGESVSLAP